MEQFDVLDCAGRKTGERIDRDRAHAAGAWHGAFHCTIAYPKNGRLVVLFQLRSPQKKIAPGRYDVSVGGHYSAGEGPVNAGPREIREELGLEVPFASLLPLGKRVFLYCYEPGVQEQEFQDVYLLPLEKDPASFTLQQEEVDGLIEMDAAEGLELFLGNIPELGCTFIGHGGVRQQVTVCVSEFVPCLDRYYLKLLQIARRYYSGDRQGLVI